ncbi:MAG TPA: glucosamine-6-phosphate deaminase [Vicinamibacteria bacterium]|nr:glucosamine-6-phosphate deaminase [Vicinamibacteria bacterium]
MTAAPPAVEPGASRVRVLDDAQEVARAAADILAQAAARRLDLVLALPTGRTPIPFYRELARRDEQGRIRLRQARAFNLDELVLPREDPRSFHAFMIQHAWVHTGLRRDRCDIPDGGAPDLERECRRYEEAIAAAGGIDLAFLGVGVDGHVAYNMPGPLTLPTHVVRLPDGLAASLGLPPAAWPLRALTMGIGTIRAARALVVLATGESKASALRALVHGPEDPEWPCSFLTRHPDLQVLADRSAASSL